MKLEKQTILFFRQGKSDKVYEVDLCEVGSDQFVVNFRYGRRGSTLREGTKTTSPVTRAEADSLFDQLVESKTSKGYSESPAPATATRAATPLTPPNADARQAAVLQRLSEGANSNSRWKLSRAIWRAGELGIAAAEPLLHPLVGVDEMTDYSIAWTMGRLGLADSTPVLERIAQTATNREHVRQMATQALRITANEQQRSHLISQAIDSLPDPLSSFLKTGSEDAFERAFLDGLGKQYAPSLLNALYYIDTPATRSALLRALREIPLQPPFFRAIRRIYKAAELRRDGQVFGLLAYRFEVFKSKYRRPSYYYASYKNPMLGDNPEHAFSVQTRSYLRRRIWTVLNRLGQIDDSDYVPMAVGTLLAFSDDDAKPVRTDTRYDWRADSYSHMHWDPYGTYWAFNQVLFRNSSRYQANSGRTSFRVADGREPNSAPLAENEAAFPHLWESQPRGLLHLLTDSRCLPVHEFAAKALRKCGSFCAELPIEVIVLLLGSKYEVTNELAFDLAVERYDASNPDFELVLALANCGLQRARAQAKTWIESKRNTFFGDGDFAYRIFTSQYGDTRQVAKDSLHALPSDAGAIEALAGRLIAFLQGANKDQAEVVNDVGEALLRPTFSGSISVLGEEVICDLLANEVEEVQAFAGSVVMGHATLKDAPTERVLRAMLDATHAPVRSMAIKIISDLPEDVLLENANMLAGLTCHELEDIRNEIRPIVKRLADRHKEFARDMVSELIRRLLTPGAPEGVPTHVSRVLREDLADHMDDVSPETVWQLLQSRSPPAQQVGGALLPTRVDPATLQVAEIVKLANHSILTVRQAAWGMYDSQVDRMRAELSTAVRILDSNWDDSRQFGFEFFDNKVGEEDLTPQVLISICDSVRPDVQQYGRAMITRRFVDEDGPEYLLKLSEHPTADLQLFASNFLVEHGAGHPERIAQMSPYFISILSRVNKSRVAKDRVLAFLQAEAVKSREAAEIISHILARISASCAIGDRAKTIEAMLELHEAFPDIELPIQVTPLEAR